MRRVLLAVALLLALPASAQAAFEVRSFTVTPSSLKAGSHPDVTIALGFAPWTVGSPPEHVRDLTLSLPPGLVGNPNATAKCAPAKFAADDCAANTRVGTTSVMTAIPILITSIRVTAEGDVYNLRPSAGEPARLGVVVRPPLGADKVFLVSRVALRPSDGGLDSIITGIPSTVGLPTGDTEMWIEGMNLTLLGRPPSASKPFVTLPTGCRPATGRVVATSANGTTARRAAPPFTPTACSQLPFKPSLAASVTTGDKPALRTVISGPPGNANTSSAAVVLPTALSVNLDALQNVCTIAQQTAGQCPEAARVGRAVARTPLLPPLTGPVYLAELPGQPLPGLRVNLSGVVSLSLPGTVDALHFPVRTEFAGIPDVPLERFELSFDPEHALRAVKDVCRGPLPRIAADLTGHNGAASHLRVPVTVTGCAEPVAGLRVRGRKLRLRVRAARGGPALKRVKLTLPRRLKAHPRRGHVSKGAKLSRRGVLTITKGAGARRVSATLSRGAFTGRLGKRRRFVLTTLDVSGRRVRQHVRARR
jgi:hypothetical protein